MSKKRIFPHGTCVDCQRFLPIRSKGRCSCCESRKWRAEAKSGGVYVPKSATPLVTELLTLDAIDALLARPGLIYKTHPNPSPNAVRTTAFDPATGDVIKFLAVLTPGKESA